jgi:hypothetical protein
MTAPHGAPIGRLVVDTSYPKMALTGTKKRPRIEVNGQPIVANWGQWPIDLPAGDHHVRVSTLHQGANSPAELTVRIHPGQPVTVFYRTPAFLFLNGAIGFQPQPTRGIGIFVGFCALIVVIGLVIAFA